MSAPVLRTVFCLKDAATSGLDSAAATCKGGTANCGGGGVIRSFHINSFKYYSLRVALARFNSETTAVTLAIASRHKFV